MIGFMILLIIFFSFLFIFFKLFLAIYFINVLLFFNLFILFVCFFVTAMGATPSSIAVESDSVVRNALAWIISDSLTNHDSNESSKHRLSSPKKADVIQYYEV